VLSLDTTYPLFICVSEKPASSLVYFSSHRALELNERKLPQTDELQRSSWAHNCDLATRAFFK